MTKRPRGFKGKGILLLVIVLLGAFLRLYQLESLPPGDGYDPAYYGVDALAILDGARPIFLESNFGREVLFSYLVTLSVALFGVGPMAIHITAAMVGILTVIAIYFLAETLFVEEEGAPGRYGGLVAALAVAISYWHLNWSRFGVRAILVPFFSALVFTFLWRGLRTDSRRDFVLSGLCLGLSVYTYQAARVLPVLVVLAFVYVAAARRTITKRHVMHLALVALVSILVFAPLGSYFLTHPGSFTERMGQTVVFDPEVGWQANVRALGEELRATVLVFSFRGDDEPIHNLPGRPALNPFFSVLFFLGLIFSLLRIRKPRYLFLLSWLAVMSTPAIFSQHGPATKRAIGTLPVVMLLLALGALALWDAVQRWAARRSPRVRTGFRVGMLALLGAGFIYSGVVTYVDYFVRWGRDPNLFTHYEAGTMAIGQYIGTLPADETIYVSPIMAEHPSLRYNSQEHPGVKSYNGRVCVVLLERVPQATTYIVAPGDDKQTLDLLEAYYPQGELVAAGPLHYNLPYFLAYRVPQGSNAVLKPQYPLAAAWDSKIALLGYDLEKTLYQPGETVRVTLYFRPLAPLDENYTVYTHLIGDATNPAKGAPLWGQDDSEPCRRFFSTSVWEMGEVLLDQYTFVIDEAAPPGSYALQVGFYRWPSLEHLPVSAETGQVVGGTLVLTPITIAEP